MATDLMQTDTNLQFLKSDLSHGIARNLEVHIEGTNQQLNLFNVNSIFNMNDFFNIVQFAFTL